MGNQNTTRTKVYSRGARCNRKEHRISRDESPVDVLVLEAPQIKEEDLKLLTENTKLSPQQITGLFSRFHLFNDETLLNKREFMKLYFELRPEPKERLMDIAAFVFNAFDKDEDGFLNFDEFIIGFAVTSEGKLEQKLDYAFSLYDTDRNGYLDKNEIFEVLQGILSLLDVKNDLEQQQAISDECFEELDADSDGKISRGIFCNIIWHK